jgi:hypothetical protein
MSYYCFWLFALLAFCFSVVCFSLPLDVKPQMFNSIAYMVYFGIWDDLVTNAVAVLKYRDFESYFKSGHVTYILKQVI